MVCKKGKNRKIFTTVQCLCWTNKIPDNNILCCINDRTYKFLWNNLVFVGGWYNSFVQWHCTIQKRTWISTEDFKYLQVFFSFCPIFHKIPHSMQCWKLFFSYKNISKEHQFVTHCSFPIFDTPKFLKSLKLKIYF